MQSLYPNKDFRGMGKRFFGGRINNGLQTIASLRKGADVTVQRHFTELSAAGGQHYTIPEVTIGASDDFEFEFTGTFPTGNTHLFSGSTFYRVWISSTRELRIISNVLHTFTIDQYNKIIDGKIHSISIKRLGGSIDVFLDNELIAENKPDTQIILLSNIGGKQGNATVVPTFNGYLADVKISINGNLVRHYPLDDSGVTNVARELVSGLGEKLPVSAGLPQWTLIGEDTYSKNTANFNGLYFTGSRIYLDVEVVSIPTDTSGVIGVFRRNDTDTANNTLQLFNVSDLVVGQRFGGVYTTNPSVGSLPNNAIWVDGTAASGLTLKVIARESPSYGTRVNLTQASTELFTKVSDTWVSVTGNVYGDEFKQNGLYSVNGAPPTGGLYDTITGQFAISRSDIANVSRVFFPNLTIGTYYEVDIDINTAVGPLHFRTNSAGSLTYPLTLGKNRLIATPQNTDGLWLMLQFNDASASGVINSIREVSNPNPPPIVPKVLEIAQ